MNTPRKTYRPWDPDAYRQQVQTAAAAERQRRVEAEQQRQQEGRHAGGRPPAPIAEVPDAKA